MRTKAFVSAFAFLLFASSVMAQDMEGFVHLETISETHKVYYRPDSVKFSEGHIYAWVMDTGDGEEADYMLSFMEMNCSLVSVRTAQSFVYKDEEVIEKSTEPGEWTMAPPGSFGSSIITKICAKADDAKDASEMKQHGF